MPHISLKFNLKNNGQKDARRPKHTCILLERIAQRSYSHQNCEPEKVIFIILKYLNTSQSGGAPHILKVYF